MRALLVRLAALPCLVLAVAPALADSLQPVQIQITERAPGEVLVHWRVPKVPGLQGLPMPVLPQGCSPAGERDVLEEPSGWAASQRYICPQGLAGREVGVQFPFYNPSLTTIIRVELLSGERFVRALSPEETSWRLPEVDAGGLSRALSRARAALLAGARHVVSQPLHLILVAALLLIGRAAWALRCVGAFAGGQLTAVALTTSLGRTLDPVASEACLALAVMLVAREVLGAGHRSRLTWLVAAAGVFHGLALESSTLMESAARVLGMDAALLGLVLLGLAAGPLIGSLPLSRIRSVALYLVGGLAVSMALGSPFRETRAVAMDAQVARGSRLAAALTRPGSAGLGSRRIAPNRVADAVQSFLTVEPFEVRHEVLLRLAPIAASLQRQLGSGAGLDLDPGGILAVDAQAETVRMVRELVASRVTLSIDGAPADGTLDRASFMTADATGVQPRLEAVPEVVDEAFVGVTFVYPQPGVPRELELTWEGLGDEWPPISATVVDPEATRSVLLDAGTPALRWENELAQDPLPRVEGVVVERPRLRLPLVSLALLCAALLLAWRARRETHSVAAVRQGRTEPRTRPALLYAAARLATAGAFLCAPLAPLSIALPLAFSGVSRGAAQRVLASVLPNVYRAFEFREETAVYDRMAVAVVGEALADVYLEQRRGLELEERGGARARVDAVEVLEVSESQAVPGGGFRLRATWTVAGAVTHFGHRHYRQNRYDADVALVPRDGLWKIQSIDVLDQERVR